MKHILAVDGGNSKTHAVVVNEAGDLLGQGCSPGTNYTGTGPGLFLEHIRSAADQAMKQADLQAGAIDYVQYGLAGADRPEDRIILNQLVSNLPFKQWGLECDTIQGLRSGSPQHIGVVLICGSGTNVAGRDRSGKTVQIGGFGYRFGDAAGGAFMAQETFRAAIRSWEARDDKTILEEMVPNKIGFSTMDDLYHFALDKQNFSVPSALTQVLHEAAERGDQTAITLLRNVGEELGKAGKAIINQLPTLREETIPIVLNGSVLQKGRSPYLINRLKETLESNGIHDYELINSAILPVYGSVFLAFDALGIDIPYKTIQSHEMFQDCKEDKP